MFLDAFSRCLAKALVEECEKALAPQMEHSFSDAFAPIDGFASEMKKFHSRLDVKLKEATIDGKLSLHNDINRMRSGLDMELLKASQEKGILESKLKAASDVYEKLQNDNMQLRTEIDAAKIDSNMLMTENVRVHSEKSSLEKEIIRMQTDFEKELHKASEEKVQLESKLNEKLLKQLENEKRLMRADYDLELIKASDEKGHLESKLSLVQTSFEKLENKNTILVEELKKASAERNTLINEMKQLLKQSEDRLKTALHELNVKKIELKKLSSENDNFLIERIQLQNEKRSMENEKDRMLTEFDGKWCKVSGEKSKLESEVSMVKTDFEKLRNDKKISDDTKHKLEEDLKKVSKERDGLLTDKVQLHNENISLKTQKKRMTINLSKLKEEKQKAEKNVEKLRIERNELVEDFREVSVDGRTLAKGDKQILEESATERRMRAELQEKLYAVVKDVNHLRLIFRPAFEIMRNSIYGVNNDLSEFKAYFERLQNKIMAQDTANKNLRIELQKVERDSLILQKDHIQLRADLNMEKSMSKIQVEAMKRQTSILDAQNIRLRIENTNLEQKIGDLKKSLEQSGMDGLSLRIQTLEQECGNLKKERDVYRARWKYVKSKPLFHKISSREESE